MLICIDCRVDKIFGVPDVELDEQCSRCGQTNQELLDDAYPELTATLD